MCYVKILNIIVMHVKYSHSTMWVTLSFCLYTYSRSYISIVDGFYCSSSFKVLCIVFSDFVPLLYIAVTDVGSSTDLIMAKYVGFS
jgi:hypothetical protein